jgi:hypothetical protein
MTAKLLGFVFTDENEDHNSRSRDGSQFSLGHPPRQLGYVNNPQKEGSTQ